MSGRLFSIIRRKSGLIDFITPLLDYTTTGVLKYRLKTDTDPGGVFGTTVVTVTNTGLVDPGVSGPQNVILPGNNVRIIMKPSDHGLPDSAYCWLKLVYIDASDAEMTNPAPSAPTLVLPPFVGNEQSGFNATAPNGSAIANSLRIDLPRQMSNFRVRNLSSSVDLYVAFQDGGPEVVVPGVSGYQESIGFDGIVSSIWVRGSGGTAKFSTQFTYANPR